MSGNIELLNSTLAAARAENRAALIGYLRGPCRVWERVVLAAGSVLLIFPGVWTDALGAACLAVVWWSQRTARPAAPVTVAPLAGERK